MFSRWKILNMMLQWEGTRGKQWIQKLTAPSRGFQNLFPAGWGGHWEARTETNTWGWLVYWAIDRYKLSGQWPVPPTSATAQCLNQNPMFSIHECARFCGKLQALASRSTPQRCPPWVNGKSVGKKSRDAKFKFSCECNWCMILSKSFPFGPPFPYLTKIKRGLSGMVFKILLNLIFHV